MTQEKRDYLKRFDVSHRARSLAGMHYDASYSSKYWGKVGAIRTAKQLAEELDEEAMFLESNMLLLSTYYSAASSALAQWKRSKWKVAFLWRMVYGTFRALHFARSVLEMFVSKEYWFKRDGEAWDLLSLNMSHSQLEVLMSPFWAIATKGARFGIFRKERFIAEMIGREACSMTRYEHEMSFALVAGKLMSLAQDEAERYQFKLVAMKGTENKAFPAKDRARLHVLLGEYEKARELGEQEGLKDVVLKSGV